MKYKTLYYDVSAFAQRLPDDCLRIIAKFAYDETKYEALKKIPKCDTLYYLSCEKYGSHVYLFFENGFYRIAYYGSDTCNYVTVFKRSGNYNYMRSREYVLSLHDNCWRQIR